MENKIIFLIAIVTGVISGVAFMDQVFAVEQNLMDSYVKNVTSEIMKSEGTGIDNYIEYIKNQTNSTSM